MQDQKSCLEDTKITKKNKFYAMNRSSSWLFLRDLRVFVAAILIVEVRHSDFK